MKDLFPGYYRLSNSEFDQLWKTCLFSFDASVLLNLYHYSDATRSAFLDILASVKARLWLPHQAALEYQRNRIRAICQEFEPYDQMKKQLKDIDETLQSSSKHPFIEADEITAEFHGLAQKLIEQLDKGQKAHEAFLRNSDPIQMKLTELFEGSTGAPCTPERLDQIARDGKDRYARRTPPGFADQNKDEPYGDLIIWTQLLEKAKTAKGGLIFVTDDLKEDWWWKHKDRRMGPHPLLRQEMKEVADCEFYLYTGESFMDLAEYHLDKPVSAEVRQELKEAAEARTFRFYFDDEVLRNYHVGPLPSAALDYLKPSLQDHDIMPVGATVHVTTQRYAEFSQLGRMVRAFCEVLATSPLDDDRILPRLTIIQQRAEILKIRWYDGLPAQAQQYVREFAELIDHIRKQPEFRLQSVDRFKVTSEQLVQAMRALAKPWPQSPE
jgi:hypothetical protein